ncbi:SNF2 family N-terminal domain-containing protein [Obelidium mucronatum]|nr:SNF2 family N-terminal domain-containing protein [Obelidium mucronatum]
MEEADSLLAQKIQQQVEREEHDKTLRQIKQSTHSQDSSSSSSSSSTSNHFQPILPRPTVMQNTVSYSGSSSSQAYNNNHTHAYIKPESKPFAGIDLTEEEDPYQAFINRPTPSSSSSSQFPQKFIPPPPVVRYSSQSSFTDKAKPYNPYIPPSPPTKQEAPIYDMSGLLLNKTPSYANHSFHGDFPGDDSAHNDPYEAPLKEGEVTEQLKDLLENVAITAAEIPIEQRLPSPPELKVQLLEHQKIGVEWMLKMEHGTNKGGILADDMGLGKTVQSITTCILNRQSDGNKKTTLIVAPTSLILQWRDELREKVKTGTFKVLVYYGKERKNKTVNSLKQFDIVITTYGTVAMEWPQVKKKRVKKDPFDRPIDEDEDVAFERDREEEALNEFQVLAQRGELFKMHWHRVILDEAHTIKNKGTRVARACVQLKANLRWCLTGTPIQNKIGELYSLIDFLKIRPYCHWDKFRDEIEKPFRAGKHKRVLKRVQALLKAICLRRTKNSTLDGRPIIVLEPKTVELVEAHFTPAEREFYQSLEKKTLLKFNAYLKAGTVMQNYSNILVLLLRLRQACCHPTLVSQNFSEAPPELLAAAEASAVAVKPQDPLTVLSDEIQQRLLKMNLKTGYECPICFDAITDGKIIPDCGHVYCSDCLLDHVAAVGVNGGNEEKVCPQCRGEIHVNQLISVDLFLKSAKKANLLEANEKLGNEQVAMSKKASGKLPIHLSQQQPAVDDDGYEIDEMDGGWISSTKIDQMMKVLLAIRRDTPNDKTIVFTQFRGMMDLCQTPLFEKNIGYVRYDGSMSADQRDAAVTTFREDPGTTVILVSLKCGSLGLNLTCANHVVIVDFWWNVAVENQAVDRVHRFGQKKAVTVHRISIKDTVEQRILALQNEKQELFNAALGEGGVKGLSKNRLGLNDLIKLFRGDGAGADLSDDDD